jgi:hypothetical protein
MGVAPGDALGGAPGGDWPEGVTEGASAQAAHARASAAVTRATRGA